MTPLLLTAIGSVLLLLARVVGRSDTITHRPYGKRYSNAPGADYENKPDAR